MILSCIHCLLLFSLCVGGFVGSLFCGVILGALSSLAIILLRKRELIDLIFCVNPTPPHPPHGVMGSSVVCDCGMLCSCSLFLEAQRLNS